MADQRYAVVFSGRIVDGADGAQVRENLARLFKVDTAKVETMFSGKQILIKKDLDQIKARGYQAALAKAGAVVEIVPGEGAAPKAETTTPPAPAAATPSATTEEPAEPPPPPQAPDLTIAEPGVILVEHEPVPPADFDTTQFDLAEVGVTLVEPVSVPPADFDTSGMELAPPGVDLTEPRKVPPADFDTSSLSLEDDQ